MPRICACSRVALSPRALGSGGDEKPPMLGLCCCMLGAMLVGGMAKGLEVAMGRVARARKVEAGARAAGTLRARLLDHREAIPPPIAGSLPRHPLPLLPRCLSL